MIRLDPREITSNIIQIDGQFYNCPADIDETMRTKTHPSRGYKSWFELNPDAALHYTKAHYDDSLATVCAVGKGLPELENKIPQGQWKWGIFYCNGKKDN